MSWRRCISFPGCHSNSAHQLPIRLSESARGLSSPGHVFPALGFPQVKQGTPRAATCSQGSAVQGRAPAPCGRCRRAREAGREPCWALLPVPLAPGAAGGWKRSRSRRLGREQAVTIRTGRAWSLSLRRSGFLLSQCFLTHFLSSQSDIYLTLQLRCTGNAKFGDCRRSPCCRVYTWKLTRSAHTRVGTPGPGARTRVCTAHADMSPARSAGSVTPCQPRPCRDTVNAADVPMPTPCDGGDKSLCIWCPWTQILVEPSGVHV